MSTVYQLIENVKQYAGGHEEISSGGGENSMQRSKSSEGSDNLRRRSEQYVEIKARNQKRKLRRRSEQYAEIKARKEKRKLRVRSLNSRPIKKLTVLIVSYYGRRSYE
jgi:hypothetical protein